MAAAEDRGRLAGRRPQHQWRAGESNYSNPAPTAISVLETFVLPLPESPFRTAGCMYICIHTYIHYVCVYVCIYIYIERERNMYTHIYSHTCIIDVSTVVVTWGPPTCLRFAQALDQEFRHRK